MIRRCGCRIRDRLCPDDAAGARAPVSAFPSSVNSPEDEARLRARGPEYEPHDADFRLITSWRRYLFACCR